MDQEPVRCRRTDGKKWRCRWVVLPNQKYCERHIHRGRLRSRKPVEDHKTFSKSESTATTSIAPVKAAPNLQLAIKSNAEIDKNICIKNQSFKIKKHGREDVHVPLEFSFFPRSVPQHGNVQHCGTSRNTTNHDLTITGSARCRRTDGKKWRCRKGVVPGQKYCMQHIHRGVKKVNNHQNFNTSLSFSYGTTNRQMGDDGNRSNGSGSSEDDDGSGANGATNSSSSDATTIST